MALQRPPVVSDLCDDVQEADEDKNACSGCSQRGDEAPVDWRPTLQAHGVAGQVQRAQGRQSTERGRYGACQAVVVEQKRHQGAEVAQRGGESTVQAVVLNGPVHVGSDRDAFLANNTFQIKW